MHTPVPRDQTMHAGSSYDHRSYSGHSSWRRRIKQDWAGSSLGDAFNSRLDYYTRVPAQRVFYRLTRRIQLAAARAAGASIQGESELGQAQLGPCYTTFPSTPAAHASIGLSGFLEFKARTKVEFLQGRLDQYVETIDFKGLERIQRYSRRLP